MSCNIILKEKGFKLTPQRRLILDIIHNADTHVTAEEIVNTVRERMPGVNKSTTYRTLELLESLGCVVKSELNDKTIYHHSEEGHHHHLVCSKCGKTVVCDEGTFHSLEKELENKYGFQVDLKHIVTTGICRECISAD
jgi:Fur family ferric uptake transcriptional regulator